MEMPFVNTLVIASASFKLTKKKKLEFLNSTSVRLILGICGIRWGKGKDKIKRGSDHKL